MRYMLLVDDCDRPEPGDPRFEGALERVNSFVEECRRRGVLRAGDPLQPVSTATTVRVRDGQTLIIDGPFAEVHEQLGGYYVLDCMQRAPQHSPVRVSSRGIAVRPWFMRWTTPRRQATSRKMTYVGTPSGSSTDDRAEGLLAELEGGPDEDHRRA